MKFIFLFFLNIMILSYVMGQNISRFNCEIAVDDKILENAFAGGLNSPQFNAMDVDMDGLKDLVVFDRVGNKLNVFIKNGSSGTNYDFAPQYNNKFPTITGWMLLVDYNNDGLEDLFTSKNGGIEVWKCLKNGNSISFEIIHNPNSDENILTYKTTNGYIQLQCDNTDIPSIVDLDSDGDVDVLSFAGTNSVYFYKNLTSENNISQDSFKFVLVETCWGKFIEHPLNEEILLSNDCDRCAEWSFTDQRHIGSTILAFDQDGDEDYDVLLGDVGSKSVTFIENGGDKNKACGTYLEEDYPQDNIPIDLDAFLGIFLLDVENDGKKDLIIAPNATNDTPYPQTINNIYYYNNKGIDDTFRFEFIETDFLSKTMIDFGAKVFPVLIDIDKDGLIDLIVGAGPAVDKDTIIPSRLYYFKNTGSKNIPIFTLVDSDFLNFSQISIDRGLNYFAPAFGDLDDDGDMDLLVGNHEGTLIFRENISADNSEIKYGDSIFDYQNIDIFSFSTPIITDINKDGLNDILVGCGQDYHTPLKYYGSVVYYQNIGSKENPLFDSNPFSYPNTPEFGNMKFSSLFLNTSNTYLSIYRDNDDEYLFTGHYFGKINVYSDLASNIYNTNQPVFKDYGNISVGSNSAPAIADIDGDGYLEMLVGTPRGGFEFWNTDIKVTSGVGVRDIYDEIKIYPNPAQSFINIDIDDISENRIVATIYDIMGKKISVDNISSGNNKINIEKLINGTYLLKIQLNKKTLNFKFIKSTY